MPILSARGGASARAYGWGAPLQASNSYESIATANGTGSSGVITFSSIPSTFKHLQIRGISRTTEAIDGDRDIYIRFNSDSGANYATHDVRGGGASMGTNEIANTTEMIAFRASRGDSSTSGVLGVAIIDILDYQSAYLKTMIALGGNDDNDSTGDIAISSGLYLVTSTINSIELRTNVNNWTTNTTFALYGIKESA